MKFEVAVNSWCRVMGLKLAFFGEDFVQCLWSFLVYGGVDYLTWVLCLWLLENGSVAEVDREISSLIVEAVERHGNGGEVLEVLREKEAEWVGVSRTLKALIADIEGN